MPCKFLAYILLHTVLGLSSNKYSPLQDKTNSTTSYRANYRRFSSCTIIFIHCVNDCTQWISCRIHSQNNATFIFIVHGKRNAEGPCINHTLYNVIYKTADHIWIKKVSSDNETCYTALKSWPAAMSGIKNYVLVCV